MSFRFGIQTCEDLISGLKPASLRWWSTFPPFLWWKYE